MCMRYMINREDLGKRVTGYMFYDGDSKGFTGLTEKQIKDTLGKGERLYGLALDTEGNIIMDSEGFKTKNYMVRSGINSLAHTILKAVGKLDNNNAKALVMALTGVLPGVN